MLEKIRVRRKGESMAPEMTALDEAAALLTRALDRLDVGDRAGARRDVCRAADLQPKNGPLLMKIGELAFKLGEQARAAPTFREALRLGISRAEAADALRYLSALHGKAKDPVLARRAIQAAARLNAYGMPGQIDPSRPTLLRIREVDNSNYGIKRSKKTGLAVRRLRGGHFSIGNLMVAREFNVFVANLTAGTMPPVTGLPKIDLIVNSVACPDLSGESLHHIDAYLKHFEGIPVINAPEKVLLTKRADGPTRLGTLPGVRFPQTLRVANDAPLQTVADRIEGLGLGYPMILRHPGSQTGKSVEKVDDRAALERYLTDSSDAPDFYVIEYIDCRGPKGFHRKTRCFFIDGVFYPVANLANDHWQIHSGDRYRVMHQNAEMQKEEQRYLADPEAYLGETAMRALHAISDVIQLDFFGIDFTVTPKGELVIFEANAAMRHNFDHADNFPYTRAPLQRVSKAFNRMLHARIAHMAHPFEAV